MARNLQPADSMNQKACYSIGCAQIFLRCFLKAETKDIRFLQRFGILPPEKMRKRDLAFWIDGAKAGFFAAPHQVFETVVKPAETKIWTAGQVTATVAVSRAREPATIRA